jgi:hypothetical protein
MTLEEVDIEIVRIQKAIGDFMSGKTITKLEIGTGHTRRTYEYNQITLESLLAYRNELFRMKSALSPIEPTFAKFSNFPLVVEKDLRRVHRYER